MCDARIYLEIRGVRHTLFTGSYFVANGEEREEIESMLVGIHTTS